MFLKYFILTGGLQTRVSQAKSECCLFLKQVYGNSAMFMFCLWLLCPRMAALTSGDITLMCQDCMVSRAWNTIQSFPKSLLTCDLWPVWELWEGNRQEGQGSPKGGNSLQMSDIFYLSLKQQEETNYKC